MDSSSSPVWRKSSFSAPNNACVQVAFDVHGGVGIRDSKQHGTGPELWFTETEWNAFVDGIAAGEFNQPEGPCHQAPG